MLSDMGTWKMSRQKEPTKETKVETIKIKIKLAVNPMEGVCKFGGPLTSSPGTRFTSRHEIQSSALLVRIRLSQTHQPATSLLKQDDNECRCEQTRDWIPRCHDRQTGRRWKKDAAPVPCPSPSHTHTHTHTHSIYLGSRQPVLLCGFRSLLLAPKLIVLPCGPGHVGELSYYRPGSAVRA